MKTAINDSAKTQRTTRSGYGQSAEFLFLSSRCHDCITSLRGEIISAPSRRCKQCEPIRATWVRAMAKSFAAEWSRTTVQIRGGQFTGDVHALQLVCTAVADIDPRRSVWRRASAALHSTGNIRPGGPYPRARVATVLIFRSTADGPQVPTPVHRMRVVRRLQARKL
jgi:hypothetical protein